MLRQLFEDINSDLESPNQKVKVNQEDGSVVETPRIYRFLTLMQEAVKSCVRTHLWH